MNDYKIDNLFVGMKESFAFVVTEDKMQKFYEITNDENPLHRNSEFAKEKGFPDKVVYGMLTASLISTLGGVYLPGKYCLIQGVEVKFTKPVLIGDELVVSGEVIKLYKEMKHAIVKVTIYNQREEKVLRGEMRVGVFDD